MKVTIKNIIKEDNSEGNKLRYIDKVVSRMSPPYIRQLIGFDIPQKYWKMVMCKVFDVDEKNVERFYFLKTDDDRQSNHLTFTTRFSSPRGKVTYEETGFNWELKETTNIGDGKIKTLWKESPSSFHPEGIDQIIINDFMGRQIYWMDKIRNEWEVKEYETGSGDLILWSGSSGTYIDYRDKLNESKESSTDKEERLINFILPKLEPPYFKTLESFSIPRELYPKILKKLFNRDIRFVGQFDSKHNGYMYTVWEKKDWGSELDIYMERTWSGWWYISDYDEDGRDIYYEDNNGNKEIKEYDEFGNIIYNYNEKEGGVLLDKRKNNLNETEDKVDRYLTKVSQIIKPPYIESMMEHDIPKEYWSSLMSKVLGVRVGYVLKRKYTSEYEVFDLFDNERVYREEIVSNEPNRWEIVDHKVSGKWDINHYTITGFDGYKIQVNEYLHDDKGNLIYWTQDGRVMRDHRDKNINESEDKVNTFINKLIPKLDPPYFYNLESFGVPNDMWEDILSKIFGYEVVRIRKRLYKIDDYDSNKRITENDEVYWENERHEWSIWEYDDEGRCTYYKDFRGNELIRRWDDQGNLVYDSRDDQEGYRVDLNESTQNVNKLYDKMTQLMRRPYGDFLIKNGYDQNMMKEQFKRLFNKDVIVDYYPFSHYDGVDEYTLSVMDKDGIILYKEQSSTDTSNLFWEELKYGSKSSNGNESVMDFAWYINSNGTKDVKIYDEDMNFMNYSTGPGDLPWSSLTDDIRNNKFFDLNY
jgi:hypothetical protein